LLLPFLFLGLGRKPDDLKMFRNLITYSHEKID
jgi:hypothetical protein